MRYLAADTDLDDVSLMQPWPPTAPASLTDQDLLTTIGTDYHFAKTRTVALAPKTRHGLQYQTQPPYGLVFRVPKGRAFIVALDLRRTSMTFGHWEGHILSKEWGQFLWVPPGFAHGYCAFGGAAEVQTMDAGVLDETNTHIIAPDDPDLAIDWPVAATRNTRTVRKMVSFKRAVYFTSQTQILNCRRTVIAGEKY